MAAPRLLGTCSVGMARCGCCLRCDGAATGSGAGTPRPLAHAGEQARDSLENLLFSLCRFHELVDAYPWRVTVVSFGFKRRCDGARSRTHSPRRAGASRHAWALAPQKPHMLLHAAAGASKTCIGAPFDSPHGVLTLSASTLQDCPAQSYAGNKSSPPSRLSRTRSVVRSRGSSAKGWAAIHSAGASAILAAALNSRRSLDDALALSSTTAFCRGPRRGGRRM